MSEWFFDAEVSHGLWRVFNAREVQWFVPGAQPTAMGGRCAVAVGPDMQKVEGIVIPRCQGGLLKDAVLGLAPMATADIVCLLRKCIEAVSAPLSDTHRAQLSRCSLALSDEGDVVAIPGLGADADESEARALGELLYAASQGIEFSDTAVPLAHRDNDLPDEIVELIDALLLDTGMVPLPTADVLEVVSDYPASVRLPFFPGEKGISVQDAPTAGLPAASADLAVLSTSSAKTTANSSITDTTVQKLRRSSKAKRADGTARQRKLKKANPKHRSREAKTPKLNIRKTVVGTLALSAVIGGVFLMMSGNTPATAPAAHQHTEAAGNRAEEGDGGGASSIEKEPADACEAFRELTAQRERAFVEGDASLLEGLTKHGSAAAKADAAAVRGGIKPSPIELGVVECAIENDTDELTVITSEVESRSSESERQNAHIRVTLVQIDGEWKVTRVEDIE